ncbi:hypothetical protein OY671_010804 [Metschnikowia pulcherrima]|nr:hypothetical protein OY671_010804 [Metschnikowia pulcherrima]
MGIAWGGMAKASSQPDSARSRRQQIGTAHDIGNLSPGIVDHHRQSVGKQAVGPQQHEIADIALQHSRDAPLQAVVENQLRGIDAQPPCPGQSPRRQAGAEGVRERAGIAETGGAAVADDAEPDRSQVV